MTMPTMIVKSNILIDGSRLEEAHEILCTQLFLLQRDHPCLYSALTHLGFDVTRNSRGDLILHPVAVHASEVEQVMRALRTLAPFVKPVSADEPAHVIVLIGTYSFFGHHFENGKMISRPVRMEVVLDESDARGKVNAS